MPNRPRSPFFRPYQPSTGLPGERPQAPTMMADSIFVVAVGGVVIFGLRDDFQPGERMRDCCNLSGAPRMDLP